MSIYNLLSVSTTGILKFKLRAFLMMLGIIIGIGTLTTVVSYTRGAQINIMKALKNFGPNGIMIHAGGGKRMGPVGDEVTTLTLQDAKAIEIEIDGVLYVAPDAMKDELNVVYEDRNITSMVMGVTPEFQDAWDWYVDYGNFFDEEDISTLSRRCVLGTTIVNELFDGNDPIGEEIRIGNTKFEIIGVLTKKGLSPRGMDMDRKILVPITTAMRRMFNVDYIKGIKVYVEHADKVEEISDNIANLLRERHHIIPPQEDDFRVINAESIQRMIKNVSGTLQTFLIILSIICLIVGGIVISNIMFISVNERRKEIGIRRAFGASKRDILYQFLVESLILTITGGIIGTIVGIGVTFILSKLMENPLVLTWEPFMIALLSSTIIGIFSGIQPARKAANINIIDAIRL